MSQLRRSTAKASLSRVAWIFPTCQCLIALAFGHANNLLLESMKHLQFPATTRGGQKSVEGPWNYSPVSNCPLFKRWSRRLRMSPGVPHSSFHSTSNDGGICSEASLPFSTTCFVPHVIFWLFMQIEVKTVHSYPCFLNQIISNCCWILPAVRLWKKVSLATECVHGLLQPIIALLGNQLERI